jgi:thiol-disulfide isomerase/thioredoxin
MKNTTLLLVLVCSACLALSGCAYWHAMSGGTMLGASLFSNALHERNRPKPLAQFDVALFDGQSTSSTSYAGKPLVVNFWADWCPPCVGEMPEFQAVYSERAGQFEMLGIAAESSKDAAGFVKQHGYTWQFAKSAEAFAAYEVRGIPMTLFVNRDGYVVDKVVGGMDRATFEAKLAKIL